MNKKKRVLLTGAAGFIGFHMAEALVARGDVVIGLDNFNSYYSVELKRSRERLLNKRGIEVVSGDICDRSLLSSLIEKHEVTHVLHLAAQAGVRYARTHPDSYIKSNIEGFLSILEVLRSYVHIDLTYASSSSVYGCNEKTPFSVSDRTDKPANLYAATKKANELMAYSYHHLYGIRNKGLRYFTVYGPWGRPDMAYSLFTASILKGEPIHLFNQGLMYRDFTYIDDVVRGTLAALDFKGECEVFNIGNSKTESLLTFVETLENLLGIKAIKFFEKESPGEVISTFADITESTNKLGFIPQISLREGLERFVSWYRTYHL